MFGDNFFFVFLLIFSKVTTEQKKVTTEKVNTVDLLNKKICKNWQNIMKAFFVPRADSVAKI